MKPFRRNEHSVCVDFLKVL